ncbi:MAG TPA: hypothetical protein PLE48_03755 [Thiobacillus sp.]|nr:hypothetical protein [Thiobacillus sp.]HQT69523.1 hypothetical protein [Thiobacillus sp.]
MGSQTFEVGDTCAALPVVWNADAATRLTLRQLVEQDYPALLAFVRNLSFAARYFRFGDTDYDPGNEGALQACRLPPERGMTWLSWPARQTGTA